MPSLPWNPPPIFLFPAFAPASAFPPGQCPSLSERSERAESPAELPPRQPRPGVDAANHEGVAFAPASRWRVRLPDRTCDRRRGAGLRETRVSHPEAGAYAGTGPVPSRTLDEAELNEVPGPGRVESAIRHHRQARKRRGSTPTRKTPVRDFVDLCGGVARGGSGKIRLGPHILEKRA